MKVVGSHTRREPLGFTRWDVEYEIEGTYYSGSSATYYEPGDPPEVELVSAVRIDPFTGEREIVPYNDWPFTDTEESSIHELLINAVCE